MNFTRPFDVEFCIFELISFKIKKIELHSLIILIFSNRFFFFVLFFMIPIGLLVFTIFFINLVLILVDIYLYKKFQKIVIGQNLNRLFVKFYLYSIPIFGLWLFINSVLRWISPIPNKFIIFSNYFLTFWYMPKLIIFIAVALFSLVKKILISRRTQKGPNNFDPSRRKVVTALGWGAVGLPYFALAHESFKTTLTPKATFVEVPIMNLPTEFKELRFVQISDIHAGSLPSISFFEKIIDIINSLNPDFVFITGDFVNFSHKEIDIISQPLSNIKANISVLACPGNHEHYMKNEDFLLLSEKIQKCNVDLLINENRTFDINRKKLQIAGVDNTSHRMKFADFEKALTGLNKDLPIILLCHDPTNWDKSIRNKRKVDLMLSGHTHGGQIAFDILNSKVSPAAIFYRQYAGLYSDGDQHLYVNTGVGMVGVPVRAGLPPEITLFKLVEVERFA